MADPIVVSCPDLHPGPEPHGLPQMVRLDWVDPLHAYRVTCGPVEPVTGATMEEACAAWNALYPARDVGPDEGKRTMSPDEGAEVMQRWSPTLCDQRTHIIQQLESGEYMCVQCGLMVTERHAVIVGGGMVAQR